MNQSENIAELAAALSKLQSALEGAKKDSTNPYYKSKYADLEAVWAAARPLLAPNGLAVTQTMGFVIPDPQLPPITTLETTLMHISGQWKAGEMPLFLKQLDAQGQGSAITYARRYCFAAILGIIQTDDDAESATPRSTYAKTETPKNNSSEVHSKPTTAPKAEAGASQSPALPYEQVAAAVAADEDDRQSGNSMSWDEEDGPQKATDSAGKVAAIKKGLLGVLEFCQKRGYTESEVDLWIKERFKVTDSSTLRLTSSQLALILTHFQGVKNQ
jgi:ERF superfamily protein